MSLSLVSIKSLQGYASSMAKLQAAMLREAQAGDMDRYFAARYSLESITRLFDAQTSALCHVSYLRAECEAKISEYLESQD